MKPSMTLPCKNRHSNMEQQEKGYHCKSCDHVLTDFRNSTEQEIEDAIRTNPGKTCGIFNPHQFDYKVSHIQVPKFRAVGLSLLGILGFLGPVVTSCESDPNASEVKQNAFNLLKFPLHVKGTVKDEQSGKPIPYFDLQVLQHGKVIKKSRTDNHGNFDILIQKDDLDNEVFKLAIGRTGYENDTITVNIKQFGAPKKVRLTIKAEAKTEITSLGFIEPKVAKPITQTVDYPSIEGIMEMPMPPEPEEIRPVKDEPIILEPETPTESPVQTQPTKKRERKNRKAK